MNLLKRRTYFIVGLLFVFLAVSLLVGALLVYQAEWVQEYASTGVSRGSTIHLGTDSSVYPNMTLKTSFPYLTLWNTTHEDINGGRESDIRWYGEQSGGERSTLGIIRFSHDGTSDDQKANLIFYTNDGNDNDTPTEAMRIDSSQHVGINNTNPLYPLHLSGNFGITGSILIYQGNYGIFDGTSATYGMRPRTDTNNLEIRTNNAARVTVASTGETTFSQGIVPVSKTADPCGSGFPTGAIFYNSTANTWCGCDGSNDVKLSDGSACF